RSRITLMHLLALEPYHGGSHEAFLRGWREQSQHRFTLLTLPAHKWKWRMRHAAITFAEQGRELVEDGATFDAVFASDMLNLAEFRGLAPWSIASLPTICYFHENQLTYPVRVAEERDLHFALTNMASALAADAVWFNSRYHRDDFLSALEGLLGRMPGRAPRWAVERIAARARVQSPGVGQAVDGGRRAGGPLHVVWAARWEHDKNPDGFFAALRLLGEQGVDFRLSVLGERFAETPPCFDEARDDLADRIEAWGYQESSQAYLEALAKADVFVSTARHEFFGISAVEAAAGGVVPALPSRLAYPEIFADTEGRPIEQFFYGETAEDLALHLQCLSRLREDGAAWRSLQAQARACAAPYAWSRRAAGMDEAVAACAEAKQRGDAGGACSDPAN
ncbi:MAG: DUF3524 domain-containing protein, partial [Phycisphaerales bacterium JB039]